MNFCITEKLLQQGYRYYKLLKTFTVFFLDIRIVFRNLAVHVDRFIKRGVSHPNFNGNIVYSALPIVCMHVLVSFFVYSPRKKKNPKFKKSRCDLEL